MPRKAKNWDSPQLAQIARDKEERKRRKAEQALIDKAAAFAKTFKPSTLAGLGGAGPVSNGLFWSMEDLCKNKLYKHHDLVNEPPPAEMIELWKEGRPWLTWSEVDGMLCTWCRGHNKSDFAVGKKHSTNFWKTNGHQTIQRHEGTCATGTNTGRTHRRPESIKHFLAHMLIEIDVKEALVWPMSGWFGASLLAPEIM
jgi:hypothetical protein